jgi:hypothetical protein
MLDIIKARLSLTKSYKEVDKNKKTTELKEKLNTDMKNWKSFTFDEIKELCIKREKD